MRALTYACRSAKERLLGDDGDGRDAEPIVVPSRGSKLIGGSIRTELTRDEVTRHHRRRLLPAGGRRGAAARPRARRPGAARPALRAGRGGHPPPGGLPRPPARRRAPSWRALPSAGPRRRELPPPDRGAVQRRRLQVGRCWPSARWPRSTAGSPPKAPQPARLLAGADLDLAVARGAAYYGHVRRGRGVRIRGGTAFAYYIAVESTMPAVPGVEPPVQALCVAPFGMEEGTEADVPELELGLVVGEPVRFRFFASSVRRQDGVGTLLDVWADDELQELDAISATLPPEGRQRRRRGAGAPACARHRGRHAGDRGRAARRQRALEGRIRRARRPAGGGAETRMRPRERAASKSRRRRPTASASTSAPRTPSSPTRRRRAVRRASRSACSTSTNSSRRVRWRRGRCCPRCATTRRRASWRPATATLPWPPAGGDDGAVDRPAGAPARRPGAGAAGRQRQELAVARRGRPAGGDPALGRAGRGAQGLTGGRQRQLPGACARGLEPPPPARTRWKRRNWC